MKLKTTVLFLVCCMVAIRASAQVPATKELLEKVQFAVKNVRSAEYLFYDRYSRMTMGEDTSVTNKKYLYVFQSNDQDPLVGFKISSKPVENTGVHTIFDGKHLYSNLTWNGNLEVADAEKDSVHVKEIRSHIGTYPFFGYLARQLTSYLRPALLDRVENLGTELVDGRRCYKIQLSETKATGNGTEAFYYVQVDTFLPVKFTVRFTKLLGKVQQVQQFDYWASNIVLNQKVDPKHFEKSSMNYVLEKKYIPEKEDGGGLLKVGTVAPVWQLNSVEGKLVNSADFAGKIVIMDFWFKSCLPCVDQMMALQALHAKFKDDQVVIIGVNTIDDPIKDKLASFLKNRQIISLNLVDGKSIEDRFQVVAAPTLYVIGKNGKILYGLEGYSTTLVKDITELIVANNK